MTRGKRITIENCASHHGDMWYSGIRICPQCCMILQSGKMQPAPEKGPEQKEEEDVGGKPTLEE
jgi:hypothetical protein